MDKYEVTRSDGFSITVEANSYDQAKRKACKYWGRTPSNPLTGVRGMKTRKLKTSEVVAP